MRYSSRTIPALITLGFLLAGSAPAQTASTPNDILDINIVKTKGKMPRPVRQPPPEYPFRMSRAGLTGAVDVEFIIDREGQVRNPYVTSSNNPWFERPAIEAVLQWKFTPAEVEGRKVNVRVLQKIIFQLDNEAGRSPWEITKARSKEALPPEMRWDLPPEPINTAYPVYPFEALQAGIKGKTEIIYLIDQTGRIVEAKVKQATTPEMGQAVLAMIETWRFKPARKKDGTPVATPFGMEHGFDPSGDGDVPVSDEARAILRVLKKSPGDIVAPKELDQPLKPLSRRPPVFPLALERAGQAGEATIEFFVDKNGDAQLPRIVSSSAPEFGYAAAQAVATWRFELPKKDGKAVLTRARVPLEFSLAAPKPAAAK